MTHRRKIRRPARMARALRAMLRDAANAEDATRRIAHYARATARQAFPPPRRARTVRLDGTPDLQLARMIVAQQREHATMAALEAIPRVPVREVWPCL